MALGTIPSTMTRVGDGDRSLSRRAALSALGSAVVGVAGCATADRQTPDGRFTVAVLPDTQHYSRLDNGIFERQTEWIADHREDYSIEAVLHLGDLVDDPTDDAQWAVAETAIETLSSAGVPSLLALGNHDAATIREPTAFRKRFPTARYDRLQREVDSVLEYGTFEGDPENAYLRQSVDGATLLSLTLEFGPRARVVDWADRVLSAHEDDLVFLTTHSYLYYDDTRVDRGDEHNPRSYGLTDVHNGIELWEALIRRHGNVCNVHSGHHIPLNTGFRVDATDPGPTVSQMFVNYQQEARGGLGWLRLLTVDPAERRLSVGTYSPVLDVWRENPAESFVV